MLKPYELEDHEQEASPHVSGQGNPVKEYLDAAGRKIGIARYHLKRLREGLSGFRGEEVPIPVQAHFEGLLFSASATSDQVGRGIRAAESGQTGKLRERATLEEVLSAIDPLKSFMVPLREWNSARILRDARKLRNMATHAHYKKTSRGPELEVQSLPGEPYRGSRELGSYSKALVDHLVALEPLLIQLRDAYLR